MSPEELQAFGVTEEQHRSLEEWLRARMGTIVGADGRGGTGTFIQLKDGRVALLTARHVVVRCILTGAMTADRLARATIPSCSVEPCAVAIDSRKDAALLFFDDGELPGEVISCEEWTQALPELTEGMPVIVAGVVGEWKDVDLDARTVPVTKWLHYWTGITNPHDHRGYIVCDVDEADTRLPSTFGGMSGGPAVSVGRRLLGVNTAELRSSPGSTTGEFYVSRLSDLTNLFQPYTPPPDAPVDYMRQEACLQFLAASRDDRRVRVPAAVRVEYFWSPSNPDGPHGRVGRIIGAWFGEEGGSGRYAINTESIFHWYDGDSDEDRLRALYEELAFFLQDTGFDLVVEES